MQTLRVDAEGLEYVEQHGPGLRLLLFAVGLLPLLAPYELLIQPHWSGFSLLLLFFALISLGALVVGSVFLAAALLGRNQRLQIDPATGHVDYHWRTAFSRPQHRRYRLADIAGLGVHVHEWESRAESYALELRFADGLVLRIGDYADRKRIEADRQRVAGWQAAVAGR